MKYCAKCDIEKPLDQFNKNKARKDGFASECRDCSKIYKKGYREKNPERAYADVKKRRQYLMDKVWSYKNEHNCFDCGLNDPVVMEFDHLGEEEKTDNVSAMVQRGVSWDTIQKEIAKCDMVCANCHRRRTHSRGRWVRNRTIYVQTIVRM